MHDLALTFQDQTVVVRTEIPEIITYLARRFRRMVAKPEAHAGQCIVVECKGDTYTIDGCEHQVTLPLLQHQVEYEILNALIVACPQFLWLHSGAVAKDGTALLVVGKSGSGKSTTVLGLCRRGWRFLSDDMLPIHMATLQIFPFSRTPWHRLPGDVELPPDQISRLKKKEVDLDRCQIETASASIGVVVLPVYRHGAALSVERLAGSAIAMALAGQIVNFSAHGPAGLPFLSEVARTVPSFRITYSDSRQLIDAIDQNWTDWLGLA